ncbi:hypothetical protein [Neptunicella sp.]|uniref:hypothetical protein n=1 Tax=Neptunicella sp. TaxID=2125986 RepID=UPI003F690AF4
MQSMTAMMDVHPVDDSATVHFTMNYSDGVSSVKANTQDATDPIVQDVSTYDFLHCHLHGCHGHFYLAANIEQPKFTHNSLLHFNYLAPISSAPSSSLYRPPIA